MQNTQMTHVLSDTKLKFGIMIEYDLQKIFRNRANDDLSLKQNGSYFLK